MEGASHLDNVKRRREGNFDTTPQGAGLSARQSGSVSKYSMPDDGEVRKPPSLAEHPMWAKGISRATITTTTTT
jgi:hypothetical protein